MRDSASSGPRSDERLMALYADGDADAFDELFRRYERRVYAFFLKRARCPHRARDLYQDLFLRLHRARDRYDLARPFAPWLFQIAHRLWVDDQRRAYRTREVPIEHGDLVAAPSDPAGTLVEHEDILRAFNGMSDEERFVLVSAKVEGIAYRELALGLGKSADAVKQMASRALRRVRATYGEHGEPAGAVAR